MLYTVLILHQVIFLQQIPRTETEWKEIAKQFLNLWNFPNCLGAIWMENTSMYDHHQIVDLSIITTKIDSVLYFWQWWMLIINLYTSMLGAMEGCQTEVSFDKVQYLQH